MKVSEHRLTGPQGEPLRLLRLLDFHHQLGLGPNLAGLCHDRTASRFILSVGDTATLTGAGLDEDPMTSLAQFLHADRQHRHAILVRFDLPRHPDNHPPDLRTLWLEMPVPVEPWILRRPWPNHSIRQGPPNQAQWPTGRQKSFSVRCLRNARIWGIPGFRIPDFRFHSGRRFCTCGILNRESGMPPESRPRAASVISSRRSLPRARS